MFLKLNKIHTINCIAGLKLVEPKSVQTCVSSPPYYKLRDYGLEDTDWPAVSYTLFGFTVKVKAMKCCLGLEPTPQDFIGHLIYIYRLVRETLRDDGTIWVNIGDSYAAAAKKRNEEQACRKSNLNGGKASQIACKDQPNKIFPSIKSKDMLGIPWMLAFALREDGWFLRQDIIWCLSGGVYLYVKSKKGVMPMMVKDMIRLKPQTIQLWNGEKWTNVLGFGQNDKPEDKIELVLRSGERIGCTGDHLWPTKRGNINAKNLVIGDIIKSCRLPEHPEAYTPEYLTEDAIWFIGLYLAEGSKSNNNILQIPGHINASFRLEKIKRMCLYYGGSMSYSIDGNNLDIRVSGKIIFAIIDQFISGKDSHDKGLCTPVWNFKNTSLKILAEGYLVADGHYDLLNNRYRLGFCRNYNLERDLRLLASRLGATIVLKTVIAKNQDGSFPSFRGEWRWELSGHFNQKDKGEIIEIRKSRARKFWDISVEDKPNLFSLASGVLTHNCKPNCMPESCKDRCTKNHEYVFLLSKSKKYYFDQLAIAVPIAASTANDNRLINEDYTTATPDRGYIGHATQGNGMLKPKYKVPNGWDTGPGNHSVLDWATENNQGRGKTMREPNKSQNFRRDHHKATEPIVGQTAVQHRPDRPDTIPTALANRRSVWSIATQGFKEAHFATFPERLPELCIKAGTSEHGSCAKCGAPYRRLTEKELIRPHSKAAKSVNVTDRAASADNLSQGSNRVKDGHQAGCVNVTTTLSWTKTCRCHTDEIKPCVVMDMFSGAGTVAMVAVRLGRDFIAMEQSAKYVKMSERRMHKRLGLFNPSNMEREESL